MHVAILLSALVLASHARSLAEQGKEDVKDPINKRSEASNEAVARSAAPAQHVRRMKSLDDNDDDKVTLGLKQAEDDDSKDQSRARLAKAADNTALPPSQQPETKNAAVPRVPRKSASTQQPFDDPSEKLPKEGASFLKSDVEMKESSEELGKSQLPILNEVKEPGKRNMASEETRPKPNDHRTKDPSMKNEYVTDGIIGRDNDGRPPGNTKLQKLTFDPKKDPLSDGGDDKLEIPPILDRCNRRSAFRLFAENFSHKTFSTSALFMLME
ncbi:hypothetical protein ANCCAN_17650 [Ancylostoma caninum]|uniref:Uncharacterized protein n=1 Tax=Ancylostoma caninum TaxID=29170 RepID=A0A368G0A1_ANCCA|nr:hypothetical protein ANCCAN_17650 [Ancylostoma caninum]